MVRAFAVLFFIGSISLDAQTGAYALGRVYVSHAATGQEPVSPESGLAPGSIADVNLLGVTQDGSISASDRIVLRIKTPGTEARDLRILSSQRGPDGVLSFHQVLIPEDAQPGAGELIVTAGEARRFTAPIYISRTNFGVFRDSKYSFVQAKTDKTFSNPAIVGEYLTLWGTGLGQPLRFFDVVVTVSIGGVQTVPVYRGSAPELPGVDQINVRIPPGVPNDCYVPLIVEVAGRQSNRVTVPISNGIGPCRHPLGLSAESLSKLDAGESIPIVSMSLGSFASPEPPTSPDASPSGLYKRWDSIEVGLLGREASTAATLTSPLVADSELLPCIASLRDGSGAIAGFARIHPLESGTEAPTLRGPGFGPLALPGQSGLYRTLVTETASLPLGALPESSFRGGDWTFERAESQAFEAFQQTFRVPPPLRLTNAGRIASLTRDRPLTIEWTGSGYSEEDLVTVTIEASRALDASARLYTATCRAAASAGSLTVPPNVLSLVPTDFNGRDARISVSLGRRREAPILFQVPLKGGEHARGVFGYGFHEVISVPIR